MKILVEQLVKMLRIFIDIIYKNRSYPRFFMLETIARIPYFAYLSVLHLYESLGFWRQADWLKIHFAQSWNELHHLLIIEELGGNSFWGDRWLARVTAFIYYWFMVLVYMVVPRAAYYMTELIEKHSYQTYDTYLKEHEKELKSQKAPSSAIDYYHNSDLYLFDEVQTGSSPEFRRPKIENLYDVFVNIRDDEEEHIKTMIALSQPEARKTFKSTHKDC